MGLVGIVRQWVMRDRIRASPREGKLLRLRVGSCVRVGDLAGQIQAVAAHQGNGDPQAAWVAYTCCSVARDFELRVSSFEASIQCDGVTRDLTLNEIETFG